MLLTLCRNQLLTLAGIDDFTVKDLSAPTAVRVRHVLSGIINFFLFEQEQAAEILEPLQDEQEELHAEEARLVEQMERVRLEIAQEKESQKVKREKAEDLKKEYREKQPDLARAKQLGLENAEWSEPSKAACAKGAEEIVSNAAAELSVARAAKLELTQTTPCYNACRKTSRRPT